MVEKHSETRLVEEFVRAYFQELTEDLELVGNRLSQLKERMGAKLEGIGRDPYLQSLSRRLEGRAHQEGVMPKLGAALQSFGAASEEKQVLDALIYHAGQVASRVFVLVKTEQGWVRFVDGQLVEQPVWREDETTIFQQAATQRAVIADESSNFPAHRNLPGQSEAAPSYCVAVPLIFGNSVPAVLYADSPATLALDVSVLEILGHGARLAIRAIRALQLDRPAAAPPETPRAAATMAAEMPSPSESRQGGADSEWKARIPVDFSRELGPREADFDLGEQALRQDLDAATPAPRPVFHETPIQKPGPEPGPFSDLIASPPRQAPVAGPPPLSEEQEKLHADALRFARLLVSELKLYNEQLVAEGRRHRDLYSRLKQDIDRSRIMYDRRVSPEVAGNRDYFHEEVVKLLAEGDAEALGRDYPGPQIDRRS